MRGYKPFRIAPFQEGMDKSLEPWLTPDQAFVDLKNVYVDRGIIKERGGTDTFGQLGRIVSAETPFANPGGNQYTKTLTNPTPILRSVRVYDDGGPQEMYDDGSGAFVGDGTGTIEYTGVNAGDIDVTFTGAIVGNVDVDYHYSDTTSDRTVRGIHLWDKDNGLFELIAVDKRRLSTWDTTNQYFENIASGTAVTGEAYTVAGKTISAITKANPAEVTTTTPHGYSTDDIIIIYGSDAVEANGNEYTITKVDATKFTLGVDSSAWVAVGTTGTTYRQGDAVADTTANIPVVPFTVKVYDSGSSQTAYDNGYGRFIGDAITASSTINYTTGAISIVFTDPVTSSTLVDYRHTATPVYDNWNTSNLMWSTDWHNLAWLSDDSSNIHIYNGTNVIDITPRMVYDAAGNTIVSARCMVLFNERLILFNTYENGTRYSQRARWHAQGNPLTLDAWRDDIAGQGDFNDATTDQEIVTVIPLKDRIVVFFENTIGFLVYTGNPDLPFSWKMQNNEVETNSIFGFWDFEQFVVSTGKYEMTISDGVTSQKANEKLPEFTLDIDYDNINMCFGHVIPKKKQAWLAYPSGKKDAGGIIFPDKVLIFNYKDNIVSQHEFVDSDGNPLATYCFENYFFRADVTYTDLQNATYWDDITGPAEYADYEKYTYGQLGFQGGQQIVLAGSEDGYIYDIDNVQYTNDNGTNFNFDIVTKKFNPFSETGKGVSLGYVDFLVSAIAECEIEVNFYLGFSDNPITSLTKTFMCDGTGNKVTKRVYCNAEASVIGYSISHPPISRKKEYLFELHSHTPYFKSGSNII